MEERTCLRCGEKIVGRIDKKFCSDGCRSDYHNALRRAGEKDLRPLNNILMRNRNILEAQLSRGISVIPIATLKRLSFNFSYYTSATRRPFRHTIYHIYDLSWHFTWHHSIRISPPVVRAFPGRERGR